MKKYVAPKTTVYSLNSESNIICTSYPGAKNKYDEEGAKMQYAPKRPHPIWNDME